MRRIRASVKAATEIADPSVHAIVLSVDEKSQVQALDRTQPGLPMNKGRLGTKTREYKRNGTTTLFAALNVLDGTVIATRSSSTFLNAIIEQIAARNDGDRETFLRKRGFSKAETARITGTVLAEEGRKPQSVFDFVHGITRLARDKPHQDARLELEGKARKLLGQIA